MLKIDIENFQSIHRTSFHINGFTVLVGENDIGKSSSFRAIHSLFNNRSGDAFITLNKPYSRVSCSFEDKCITWSKHRKSGASYTFSFQDTVQEYDKVGRSTPDFISDLGFGEITLKSGKIDPHFSKQREEPFLVSSSGSKQILTEFFSELLKFGTLGKSLIQVSKDIRKVNTDINVLEKQKDLQISVLSNFPDTEDLKISFEEMSNTHAELEKAELASKIMQEYRSIPPIPENLPTLPFDFLAELELLKKYISDTEAVKRFKELPKLDYGIGDIPDLSLEIDYLSFLVSCTYCKNKDIPEYADTNLKYLEFLVRCKEIRAFEKAIEDMHERAKVAEKEFLSALEEMGVCPLCERSSLHA